MGKSTSVRRRASSEFTAVLTSAVLEWLLIFLLFVNALYSYLLTRLARLCGLQTPCLLCSRLDHVFGEEAPGLYLDLICGAHKLEVSSLVFCHVHNNLADVHGMCEGCLLSYATEKKSNSETYRLLVHALGTGLECSDDQESSPKDPALGVSTKRFCSCCSEPCASRLDTRKLEQFKSVGPEVDEVDIPLPASVEKNRVHLHDGLKCRERVSREVVPTSVRTRRSGPLSHIGYSELKITSDSESDIPFSDNGEKDSACCLSDLKEEIVTQNESYDIFSVHPEPLPKLISKNLAPEELIDQVSISSPSYLVRHVKDDVGELPALTSSASAAVVDYGLEELKLHEAEEKTDVSPSPEHTLLQDVKEEIIAQSEPFDPISVNPEPLLKPLSNDLAPEELIHPVSISKPCYLDPEVKDDVGDLHALTSSASAAVVEYGLEELNLHQVEEKTDVSQPLENISLQDVPPSSDIVEVLVKELAESSNATGIDVHEPEPFMEIKEISKLENGSIISTELDKSANEVSSDRGPTMNNLIDLSDAYKLIISNKGKQASNMAEQHSGKDFTRVSGDLKLWLSQVPFGRGLELSLSDMSPILHGQWEPPSPIGLQILQKRISLERNTSGLSLDGSIVSEIEGENMVDRLKRQLEYDRKSLNALYKELEEERNASAISANQALNMITRLQEEKATLQMEALQYQRMMEEQAEYDEDALQKAHELLEEKEKALQDLETKLEIYRQKFPNESIMEKTQEAVCNSEGRKMTLDHSDESFVGYSINTPCNTPRENVEGGKKLYKTYTVNGNNSARIREDSLVGFEDERSYISLRLKKLEKKLHLFSNNGDHFPNDGYSEQEENDEVIQRSSQIEEDGLLMHMAQEKCSSSTVDPQFFINGKHASDCEGKDQEAHLVAAEHEISVLNERLKALEADRNFLEHTINSLRTDKGIQFIQEIAHDLQELRRIGIRREQAPQ